MELKKDKGVTLIALTVTIIVLLILAGISIPVLTGENGIIKQAKIARIESQRSGIQEQIDIMVVKSTDRQGKVNKEKLIDKLQTLPEGKEILDQDDYIYVIYPEYTFEIELDTGEVIYSQVEVSDDKNPGELDGEGTEENPFKIECVEDLVAFFEASRKGEVYSGKKIILTRSLDIKSVNSYGNSKTTQFGDYNEDGVTEGLLKELISTNGRGLKFAFEFQGNFEGNGKEIRNIYSNICDDGWLGFIGDLDSGTIRNLKLHGRIDYSYNKSDFSYIRFAAFTGRNKKGIVENCISEVNINVKLNEIQQDSLGNTIYIGMVANNEGLVNNCINKGNINVSISEKVENEEVYISVIDIGGVTGNSKGKIVNCINFGDVNVKKIKLGALSNPNSIHLGGISGTTGDIIKNVINVGNITGHTDESIEISGIVGADYEKTGLIENATNIGIVLCVGKIEKLSISGITADGRGTFKNVYNIGKINNNGNNTKYIGAIVGDVHTSTVCENCIYLASSSPAAVQSGDFEGVSASNVLLINEVINYMNQNVNENNKNEENIEWKTWKLSGNQISF